MSNLPSIIYSVFANKSIKSKVECDERLIQKLLSLECDFVFTSCEVKLHEVACKYLFEEKLFVNLPKNHFLSKKREGVSFSEIDGQPFLVANNLGIWEEQVLTKLTNSKFFPQEMNNLNEIVNASKLPTFSTNVTNASKSNLDRVSLPILDKDASVEFYICYLKSNKQKVEKLLKYLSKDVDYWALYFFTISSYYLIRKTFFIYAQISKQLIYNGL